MTVLVFGATGAVGAPLLRQLVAAGRPVVGAARKAPTAGVPGARYVEVDLLDPPAVDRVVDEVRPTAIVHQATALTGLGTDLRHFDTLFATTNRLRTEGTATLLAAARRHGDARLVVQSFCGWPFAPTGGPVKTEDDPLDPDPPAVLAGILAAIRTLESTVSAYPNGVVLRYGGLYGPGTSLAPGEPQVEAVRKRQFPVIGKGTGVWSFTHVEDAAAAAVAALDRGHGIYNVVDDNPAPVSEWLPELARIIGARKPLPAPAWLARLLAGRAAVHMMTRIRGGSNAKAKRDLAWRPVHPDWRQGFATELA